MKIIKCTQGGSAWLKARCGIVTATGFCNIVTSTGKATKGAARRRYALELCAERMTGQTAQNFVTAAMQRGIDLEPRARAWYSLETGNVVEQVGFCLSDCGRWGCSPDGLIGDTSGLEIKCPGPAALLDMQESGDIDPDYMMQMQACMWITGRDSWDFVLWTDQPGLPCTIQRVPVNREMQVLFAYHLPVFCAEVDAMEQKLRALPIPQTVQKPIDPTASWGAEGAINE